MTSSTFSSNPLLRDLREDSNAVKKACVKVVALCALVLLVDRGLSAILLNGLNRYFELGENVDVLCIGHSRTVLGIDPDLMESWDIDSAKYAIRGANANDRLKMLEHFLNQAAKPPRFLIFEVSGFTFNDEGLSSNSYKLFMPFLDQPPMDSYVTDQARRSEDTDRYALPLRHILHLSRYDEGLISLAIRGYNNNRRNLKTGTLNTKLLDKRIESGKAMLPKLPTEATRATFDATLKLASDHGMHVVLVYIPTVDIMNNLDRKVHDQVVMQLQQIADQSETVTFLDLNSQLETRHELFADGIHMNRAGQELVSERIKDEIKRLEELN